MKIAANLHVVFLCQQISYTPQAPTERSDGVVRVLQRSWIPRQQSLAAKTPHIYNHQKQKFEFIYPIPLQLGKISFAISTSPHLAALFCFATNPPSTPHSLPPRSFKDPDVALLACRRIC